MLWLSLPTNLDSLQKFKGLPERTLCNQSMCLLINTQHKVQQSLVVMSSLQVFGYE